MPSWWKSCVCKPPEESQQTVSLDFRQCNFVTVPPEVFAHELTLEKVTLASNQISALPPSLFCCHELRELDVSENELTTIPPAIGSLARLQRLDLSRNSISNVADAIKNCKNLQYLNLSLNHLVKVPEGVCQLVNLEELNLTDTGLEFLSANFCRLTKLKVLELRENLLQNLPKSMTRFSHIQRLDLGTNDLREVPEVISTMTTLTELYLDHNKIGVIPSFIGQLTKLTSLDCSENLIYEASEDLCKCTKLTDLNLSKNTLSCLPEGLGQLEAMTILRIDNNNIEFLPPNFGRMTNLHELSARGNSIRVLPPSFGLLRNLSILLLDENLLTEIPKDIGSCTQLSILNVSRNKLTSIPSEVGYLSNLKVLCLSGNLIQYLPVTLLNCPKLGAIWISESQSKPMLQLNKETLSSTGQVVLTCFLLPQVPPLRTGPIVEEEEDDESCTRRRKAKIKFADFPDEPVIEECPPEKPALVGPSTKSGLSRAPTPYPKELRALAKHASMIRHGKEQNGDMSPRENACYEEGQSDMYDGEAECSGGHSSPTKGSGDEFSRTRETDCTRTERLTFQYAPRWDSTRSSGSSHGYRQQNQGGMSGIEALQGQQPSHGGPAGVVEQSYPLWAPDNNILPHENTSTPPPYHIAARRAAFFRNSSASSRSSSSSTLVNSNTGHDPAIPFPFQEDQKIVAPNSTESTPRVQPYMSQVPSSILSPRGSVGDHNANTEIQKTDEINSCATSDDNCLGSKEVHMVPSLQNERSYQNGMTVPSYSKFQHKQMEGSEVVVKDFLPPNSTPEVPTFNDSYRHFENAALVNSDELGTSRNGRNSFGRSGMGNCNIQKPPTISRQAATTVPPYEDNGVDVEQGIIETTIPTEWQRPGSSGDELEGGTDSSDGPPILPMRPITTNYKQITAAALVVSPVPAPSQNIRLQPGKVSRIPVSPRKAGEVASPPVTPLIVTSPHSTVYSDRRNDVPALLGGSGDATDSGSSNHKPNSIRSNAATVNGPAFPSPTAVTTSFGYSSTGKSIGIAKEPVRNESPVELPKPTVPTSLRSPTISESKIPISSKKPWIFGTHRNTRVVSLEYGKKTDDLGFSVCNRLGETGTFIDAISNAESTVKRGDKLLEVDGIDVSKMRLEIVTKILSNCKESINLLVSRQENGKQ